MSVPLVYGCDCGEFGGGRRGCLHHVYGSHVSPSVCLSGNRVEQKCDVKIFGCFGLLFFFFTICHFITLSYTRMMHFAITSVFKYYRGQDQDDLMLGTTMVSMF